MQRIGRYINKTSYGERRSELRKKQTKAEWLLWKHIRAKKFGVKFRRQYNIGNYIVDLYCHELRLVIEVDGSIHGNADQIEKDKKKDWYLQSQGYNILRYRNEQIYFELTSVVEDVYQQINKLIRLTRPLPTSPDRGGE